MLALVAASPAAASPPEDRLGSGVSDAGVLALITNDDAFALADLSLLMPASVGGSATQHYGPYASGSPDSGTCGNDWAEDQYDRVFTVRQTGPTSYTVIEQFKNGTFVTNEGFSPGACQLDDGSSTVHVSQGYTGKMHGYLVISVTGTQTSTSTACQPGSPPAPCTTTGFITSHFSGTSTTPTFFFHYSGFDGTNQALVEHEWKNASDDRGGNHGDIADA
jgi:hypothetical protein